MQCDEVAQRLDDVLAREDLLVGVNVEAELLVDLVATNASKVVALAVEVEAVEQRTCGVDGRRLARTLTTVDLDEGVLARGGNVTLERGAHDVGVAQEVHDLVVGLGISKGAQQHGCALTTLAVDLDDQVTVLVDLKLEPCATSGDELHVMNVYTVVLLGGEVHTRRTDELRDNHALGTVDDKGAALGHEREVAHEDELLLDLARLLVDEAHINKQRGLIGDVLGTALGDGAWRVAKLVLAKRHLHRASRVLDGREFSKRLGQAVGHEPLKRFLLNRDEVGQFHRGLNLAEAHAIALLELRVWGRLCGRHRAFPP